MTVRICRSVDMVSEAQCRLESQLKGRGERVTPLMPEKHSYHMILRSRESFYRPVAAMIVCSGGVRDFNIEHINDLEIIATNVRRINANIANSGGWTGDETRKWKSTPTTTPNL